MKLIWYWISKLIFSFAKLMSKQPLFKSMFMGISASYAVGAGGRAYNEGRYEDAYNILMPVADFDINDVYVGTAQYYVALLFFNGYGVKQDKSLAEEYLKKAAERDNDEAKEYLKRTGKNI